MDKTEAPSEHKLILETAAHLRTAEPAIMDIVVVFTTTTATMRAVERASRLAKDLHARLRLLVPQVVSYALPLNSPPVLVEFQESRFRRLAAHLDVDLYVEIYLCRDAADVLARRMPEHSLAVIGSSSPRWWPSREWFLARRLRGLGHEVALVYGE